MFSHSRCSRDRTADQHRTGANETDEQDPGENPQPGDTPGCRKCSRRASGGARGTRSATCPWEEQPSDFTPEEPDEELPLLDEAAEALEGEDTHAADDALGLYLRQMGAIPLLDRKQELALAERLETKRQRYRLAALCNWRTLGLMVETFERVLAGQLPLDPTIDVVATPEPAAGTTSRSACPPTSAP